MELQCYSIFVKKSYLIKVVEKQTAARLKGTTDITKMSRKNINI